MVQEFHVLRCFSCQTFQVQQVKKSNKWACTVCGEKQSVIKEYGRGRAVDCRKHVQKLNSMRGELLEVNSESVLSKWEQEEKDNNEGVHEDLDKDNESQGLTAVSRWTKYTAQTTEGPMGDEDEEEENVYTERDRFRSQGSRKRMKTSAPKSAGGCYGNDEEEDVGWTGCRGVKGRSNQPPQPNGKFRSWDKGYASKYSCSGRPDDMASCASTHLASSSSQDFCSFPTASTSSTYTVANSSKKQYNTYYEPPAVEVSKHLPLLGKDPSVPPFQKFGESKLDKKDSKWNKFLTVVPTQPEDEGDGYQAHHLSLYSGNTLQPDSTKGLTDIGSGESRCHLDMKTNAGVLGLQKSVGNICVDGSSSNQPNSHTFTSKPAGFENPVCNNPPLTKRPCPSLPFNSLFFTDEDFDDTF
ncbi:MRN complex-interacting protein isoform X2 [Myxocyprinus asiaticus]|uniref:MRN complex-interacting protein isoform X2 n=1 Tax=Myxocyprinus asiaticus TaxID=70543 RepID=UPI0022223CA8|nr:MRN complex-interacting protein isoform X2 [Myxocyprinus asiaticus]